MICTAFIKFEGHNTIFYCNYKEVIEDIIKKFCSKTDQNPGFITFSYSGKYLNKYSTLREIIHPNDRDLNEIKILDFKTKSNNSNSNDIYTIKINYKNIIKNFIVDPNKTMLEVLQKSCSEMSINKNNIYFCLSERIVYEKLEVKNYLDYDCEERNSIELSIVNKNSDSIKKSNQIICPLCGNAAQILLDNNKITIFGCKYSHSIENLNFQEFESTQLIDLSKIICQKCKTKSKYNCMCIYYCNLCDTNFCLSCLSGHDNSHKIVDYSLKFDFAWSIMV